MARSKPNGDENQSPAPRQQTAPSETPYQTTQQPAPVFTDFASI
ncbi:hypothetical protein ACJ5NV_05150 [Loktanella agnita]